jgi:cobalt-zinc-cadmium efflux system outer membrane protein
VLRRLLLISGLLLPLGGCAWAVRQETDQTVGGLVAHPFDIAPERGTEAKKSALPAAGPERPSSSLPANPADSAPEAPTGAKTSARLETQQYQHRKERPLAAGTLRVPSAPDPGRRDVIVARRSAAGPSDPDPGGRDVPPVDCRVQTVAWTAPQPEPTSPSTAQPERPAQPALDLQIPPRVPGSEAPRIDVSKDESLAAQQIDRIFPELPALPEEPKVQPGPGGKPYTLADFQRVATANSPTLRQSASDVVAARGNVIQAMTYPNPTTGYIQNTSAVNNTGGVQAGFISQPIITGGKQRLGVAASEKDLDNSILALKRARSDLSTAVRNAYFTVLVDVETLVITRALVRFSDDIYRLQVGMRSTLAAPYEPTALRAQTYTNRLAYKQAIASYIYDWKALVATIGLPQLPLSQIAGQVDRFIPYYDFDAVRIHMLHHHTDVLAARNGVKKAQYLLKLAQVTPLFPNLNVYLSLEKDFVNPPHGTYQTLGLGLPLPLWDQNKGNIIAAQAALVRASEENHRVEVTLTGGLATAYETYRNNLYALESFRRNVLPNLVRYYRGIFARRQMDPSSAFSDLVFAQQNLSSNVTTYIGILGSVWSSVVAVADFLQTDDLFQVRQRVELPELPDFNELRVPDWVCGHAALAAAKTGGDGSADPPHAGGSSGPPPSRPAGSAPSAAAEKTHETPSPAATGSAAAPHPPQTVQPAAAPPTVAPAGQPGATPGRRESHVFTQLMRPALPRTETRAQSFFHQESTDAPPDLMPPIALAKAYFGKQ